MIQFYAPDIKDTHMLPESDSGHVVRVLRLGAGDEIVVVDGCGNRFKCVILDAHPKHVMVDIISEETPEPSWKGKIILAVAPTKKMDRMEWLAEKSVEIGIDELVLLECKHSERRKVNMERLEKIMVSAMKQSLKAHLPRLSGMLSPAEFAARPDLPECRVVGYCSETIPRLDFAGYYPAGEDVAILIGPEGDFSSEEIEMLLNRGFRAVTFGNMRLRTETAALYGLTAVHVLSDAARVAGLQNEK